MEPAAQLGTELARPTGVATKPSPEAGRGGLLGVTNEDSNQEVGVQYLSGLSTLLSVNTSRGKQLSQLCFASGACDCLAKLGADAAAGIPVRASLAQLPPPRSRSSLIIEQLTTFHLLSRPVRAARWLPASSALLDDFEPCSPRSAAQQRFDLVLPV